MSNWVDKYKKLVISSRKQHILVADPDSLFDYVELKSSFENEGYTLYRCPTELSVRLTFELQVRNSQTKSLLVAPATYQPLPDIAEDVHFQVIGLHQLFPNLDAKAIKGLSFNALCLLSNIKPYEDLGHEKTLKFLLENLYNVDFDTLTTSKAKERVLHALVTVFLEKNGINESLSKFLTKIAKPYFPTLLNQSLSKASLVQFIQEQWLAFVKKENPLLDFNESLLNRSLGYLFAFDYLRPIQISADDYDNFPKPLKIGVYVNETDTNDSELEGQIEYLKQQLEIIEDLADQWFKIIQVLSTAKLRQLSSTNEELKSAFEKIERGFNLRFQRFIENTYPSLFSLSGVRHPVVVSRVLEHLNAKPSRKKVLLVIDGMNYWQWNILSSSLASAGINFSVNASLAYIPTITAWSRQAIFKGDKPDLATGNAREGKQFEEYWIKQGVLGYQIDYKKFSVHEHLLPTHISQDVTTLGLVCNDLDNIMHGSILGDNQLRMSTEQWVEKSKIVETIQALQQMGFQIFLTSDHGNIEAKGIKNLKLGEKVGALSRSKRHLHFTNDILLKNFLEQNPSLEIGKKDLSLYFKNKEAFTNENTQVITHGGSHFWEVIIPFISIHEQ